MKDALPKAIYLKDYQPPYFWIEETKLEVELGESESLVTARLSVKKNTTDHKKFKGPLKLSGIDLELLAVAINDEELDASQYDVRDEELVIGDVPDEFELYTLVKIHPENNKALEGIYKSGTMFCSQCEAEGFRRITYYLDRPDVMSIFTTKVIADKQTYPILLSNGNPIDQGETEDGKHFQTWHDPFKKPAYLFALVAGDLKFIEDSFTTMSGRNVKLQIFVEPHNIDKCDYAMDALKRSMKWDEEVYGREYDLDLFMIVATDYFNMGAMENKGLNIFNSSCVLAKPDTATDLAYQRIEAVVAHEYFHNWSGNRVTCRDWFQLSLKEGFTVFRDAQFSSDMNSATVKRVEDVNILRSMQFAEDAGPMAHPIRPASFIEISNFYTLTVYEKGAEVVRMIYNILGPDLFRKGSDLYFDRHDGQAVTTEDFVKAMADVSGVDFSLFQNWYDQAGTPSVEVSESYDTDSAIYSLTFKQSCPPSPGQPNKKPYHIPVGIGLLDREGNEYPIKIVDGAERYNQSSNMLNLTQSEETFTFEGINEKPVPSLLRGFSAPVKLSFPYSREDKMFLIANDTDGFNRWDACSSLSSEIILELAEHVAAGKPLKLDPRLVQASEALLRDDSLDKAMVAHMLNLPSINYLTELVEVADVASMCKARKFVKEELAKSLQPLFLSAYKSNQLSGPYQPLPEDMAKRSLKNTALSYLACLQDGEGLDFAKEQFNATNMTDQGAAFSVIVQYGNDTDRQEFIKRFYELWQDDSLVVDQWFRTQASADWATVADIKALIGHKAFDLTNPNKVRAVLAAFAMLNAEQFYKEDGSGFDLLSEYVIKLDPQNPQLAARILAPLTKWKKYSVTLQGKMKAALEAIKNQEQLSKDVFEVVSKSLDF